LRMTIFSSTSGRGESTGYGVYSTLLRPVSRRGDTPEIPWLARWVGSSAQGGNECNRTAMLAGSPTALSASRRKNSRNEVLGSGTEVCISVDRAAEGASGSALTNDSSRCADMLVWLEKERH
jgi:hypothetical protein